MADFTLVIGNRNCSSWSLRAWLVARASGLDFATELVRLGPPDRSVGLAAVGLMPTALAGRGDDETGASRPAHISTCSAPGSLDTSLSHAAGLIEIAACHA